MASRKKKIKNKLSRLCMQTQAPQEQNHNFWINTSTFWAANVLYIQSEKKSYFSAVQLQHILKIELCMLYKSLFERQTQVLETI